ncbi:hypothetical protein AnigIFM49718_005012 [Aspergillus niger]|nr:hypothetical protein AnigIFM49718_005012 [Aspergillus niger]
MAIASRAAECAQLFDKYARTLDGDELLKQDMENEIFRFNLWAANNFILTPGRASMDWRLRNAPLLQSTMAELLDDLKADLIKQSTFPFNSTIPTGMPYEIPLHAVSETLDGLFRLSRAIRRSGILRRYVKVGNYVEFDENGVNLTEAFRNGAKTLIEFRMKESKASNGLRERIINTVCLRQQYFSYLKAKKATNAPISGADQSHQSTPRSALRATASVTGSLTSKAQGAARQQSSPMRRPGPSTMTATTAQPDRIPKAYSVKSAHEQQTYDVDCNDADIPPPPNVSGNRKESECPYCFLACSKEELSGRRWKHHIIQDLMPYICVLEPCPTPNSLFESGKDWLSHMKNQHPVSGWTCVDSTHDTTFFFQSESGFREHLHQYHEDQFDDDDDIDDIAAACYQKLPDDIIIRECPFCPTVQKLELKPKDMINHVANHLISLAQISLAGHIDDGRSQSAWSGSSRDSSSLPASIGSLPERLHSEFRDDDETEYLASVSGEVIPDADEELIYALWQKVQKPQDDPSLDLTLRHFIAQSGMQAKVTTEGAAVGSNDLDTGQSFEKGQATAPELDRSSEDSAGVLQETAREGSLKIVEMFDEEGNPRLDDEITDDVPPFLCQSDSEIYDKFEELEKEERMRLNEGMLTNDPAHPYALEQDPEVSARNRYDNVQAWANSRIHLRVPEGECDFINASPIILRDSVTQEERTYIATQGPIIGYLSHFWHMVFHESKDVAVIVMLTQTFEAGREKCAQYFPLHPDQASMFLGEKSTGNPLPEVKAETVQAKEATPAEPAAVDQLDAEDTASEEVSKATKEMTSTPAAEKIETAEAERTSGTPIVGHPVAEVVVNEESPKESNRITAAQKSGAFVTDPNSQEELPDNIGKITLLESMFDVKSRSEIRKLELTIGSKTKIVWHFLFAGWPEYSKPEGDDREALLELIKLSASKSGPQNPRVVHCSSGVGRTGTFIALDHLLQELESGQLLQLADPDIDPVFETVNQMREQRMMMVYNVKQFQFIYDVLREQTDIKLGKVRPRNNGSLGSQMEEDILHPTFHMPDAPSSASRKKSTEEPPQKQWQFIDASDNSGSTLAEAKHHIMQEYMRQIRHRPGQSGVKIRDSPSHGKKKE